MADERAEQLKGLANKAVVQSDFATAVKHLTEAIGLKPQMHVLWSNRAFALSALDRHADALADAQHCMQIAPKQPKGYLRAGRALISLGRCGEAATLLDEAVALFPQDYSLQEAANDAEAAAAAAAAAGDGAPSTSAPDAAAAAAAAAAAQPEEAKLASSYYYAAVPKSEHTLPTTMPQRIAAAGGAAAATGPMDARGHVQEDIERKGEDSYYYAHQRKKDFTVPTVPQKLNADGSMTPWDGK